MSISSPQKSAALALFSFDDGAVYTLVQNAQVNLQHCIDGYDRSVMLKEDFVSVGQSRPDSVLAPTRENFVSQIRRLAADGYYTDIFVFTHGGPGTIYLPGSNVDESYLRSELSREKTDRAELPIRMVYQMNCYGETLNQTWLDVGAKAVCGARFVNYRSNQFNGFAREWEKGNVQFDAALRASNTDSSRLAMHALIEADSLVHPGPTRCPLFHSVLGDHPCAESYFRSRWDLGDGRWQEGKSGAENIDYSSYMYRPGLDITRNDHSLMWHP